MAFSGGVRFVGCSSQASEIDERPGQQYLKEEFLAPTFASQLDTLFGRLFGCPPSNAGSIEASMT